MPYSEDELHIFIDSVGNILGDENSDMHSSHVGEESAIRQIMSRLEEELPRIREKLVVIHVERPGIENMSDIPAAVHRYCEHHIVMNEQTMRRLRKQAWRLIWRVLVIGIACLLLALAVTGGSSEISLSPAVTVFITSGLSVIAWVALWDPVEVLIYGVSEYKRENAVYRAIKKMEISILTK